MSVLKKYKTCLFLFTVLCRLPRQLSFYTVLVYDLKQLFFLEFNILYNNNPSKSKI